MLIILNISYLIKTPVKKRILIIAIQQILSKKISKVKSFSIDLPEGFEGPITQSSGPMEIMAFAKPHKGQVTASLIQFSVINLKEAPSDIDLQSATVTNKNYLMKMLGGIERRRSKFWKEGKTTGSGLDN